MKFLLISPFTSISGSAIRFWNIAQQLQMRGHSVIYVERVSPDAPPPTLKDITYLGSPSGKNLFVDILHSLFFNLGVLWKHRDCDIYYALKPAPNNCIPALIARLMGKRIFLDIDDLDYGYLNGLNRSISKFFFDSLPRFFECVTCHTEKLRQYLIQNLKIPESRIYFLAQGVSDVFLAYDISKRKPDSQKSIVYCATLSRTTDLEDLLPMFQNLCQKHPDLLISVIGDGSRRQEFEAQCRQLGIAPNVVFLGRIEHKLLPDIIARHWIGVNYMRPSLTNNCRAIFKIREYLAVGLQVVCNDVGDASTFSDYIYCIESIPLMESRIDDLLHRDAALINTEGRAYVERTLSWQAIVGEFCSIIEEPNR